MATLELDRLEALAAALCGQPVAVRFEDLRFLGLLGAVKREPDGTRVLAGGPNDGGAVRLYTLVADAWEQASSPVFHTTGRNGTDVAISADGRTIAASAPYEHGGAGEVCLYDVP